MRSTIDEEYKETMSTSLKINRGGVIIDDEEYKAMALSWVRLNIFVRGRPNMTAATFRTWVVSVLLPQAKLHHPQVPSSISDSTAVCWLHQIGFEPASTNKRNFH